VLDAVQWCRTRLVAAGVSVPTTGEHSTDLSFCSPDAASTHCSATVCAPSPLTCPPAPPSPPVARYTTQYRTPRAWAVLKGGGRGHAPPPSQMAPSLAAQMKSLVNVIEPMGSKFSDYVLVLCHKLHICTYDRQVFFR